MKNKIIIKIFVFLFFLNNTSYSKDIQFKANEIEFLKDKNLTIAYEGSANIENDEIIIKGQKIQYFNKKFLLIADEGNIFIKDKNLEIESNKIEYNVNESNLNFKNKVQIKDNQNNLIINSNEVIFDNKKKIITSKSNSEIYDGVGNYYKIGYFEYSLDKKLIKLKDIEILDNSKNIYKTDQAFLDLTNKELAAKDIDLEFKSPQGTENEPRLKGRSLISDQNNTIVKKGTFTLCKKREDCPPWEMSADEIKHDKKKKTIYYKNASLKIYDQKVFYFPKFFHPDPSVKRQTGFLIPKIQDNTTSGLSLNLPYFIALADNKDVTLSPRLFAKNQFLLQSEYRQKNKESNHVADLSQFLSNNENSKGHLFYNSTKKINSNFYDDIDMNIRLEQVSDETYLKAYKIKSPIIENTSNLKNSINLNLYKDDLSINANFDVYEDLNKLDSDKYEYVPNFSFSKVINNNYSFNSRGFFKHYDTNINEKVLINNFNYKSNLKYFDNGVINEKNFLVKNVISNAKHSSNFKNKQTASIVPSIESNYLYPLKKDSGNFTNSLTPKLSLRLSPSHTKNLYSKDRKIDYNNIYDLERLGILDANEGGFSATYGYEYVKTDKSNLQQKIKFGIANNIRFEENKNLPANSNLGDKTSDFLGVFEYNPKNNLKLNYDFSLRNNLIDKNYELFGFEFFLNNLNSKFEYVNENNSNQKNSYLYNKTSYKFNKNNSLIFEARENKEQSFTEFYNLIYQYENDCLIAGIEYNKDYYNDQDLKPTENLIFRISIIPFGGMNSPNLK